MRRILRFDIRLNPRPWPYLGYATPWANIVEELRRPHFGRYLWR